MLSGWSVFIIVFNLVWLWCVGVFEYFFVSFLGLVENWGWCG